MKIILTGGAGFIGSCLLWKLNQKGISDVLVVDHFGNSSKWKNLIGKKFKDYIEKDDFLELILTNKISKNINMIIHFGACTSTTEQDASYLIKNNYLYSQELVKWAQLRKIRFSYASSAATYGKGDEGYKDTDESALRLKPLNAYGFSKYLFDLWLIKNKLYDKVTGFKFFNVFGPNEYHKGEMQSLISKSLKKIISEGKIRLFKSYNKEYNSGEQKRDFIYIKDALDIIYYFIEHPNKKGIFNLGTGKAHTWNQLVYAIFSALDMKPKIEYIDMPEGLKDNYQYYTQANLIKLRKAGCKHKFFDFNKAVEDCIMYLKDALYL
ncbi:MAG: ADP-glyceromanno-heptose 6-epimerase [Armatimonadetes bacterium]|nr:ADP-glyceromanno-heptose 6-epimerase [Armatimonadota bacterium]